MQRPDVAVNEKYAEELDFVHEGAVDDAVADAEQGVRTNCCGTFAVAVVPAVAAAAAAVATAATTASLLAT